ncbi:MULTISPECIES: peptide chain release factor N(5)-glutamine methyltransferase [unclassified Exiguobacterium]|uniref:peptide chain release factor N(5)-glutamine methyltransferase n=1 Tax=unclassified Exiguobacterium TaxID=2644629 RepID=UPI00103E509A|nr:MULTISPECIES: peptide chain release factor N(5)-glutamine methyltransferase [unclassified Exiguobacterium]TCI48708.1 peptide chain release factor N(5)-glutamine methyltransferase [Exiguobacterium sp. SH5S32]TCI55587.1 peptide chain release factor N(5)-glutamine methyltransferase [Exiguobacterium sp. SH1S4]TCI63570.1 peptide chain release factor N(5)-glutamine methyltransferase [Exiguobacterium sp. SH0S2]TCI75385.1 peptide chain release factor N(5)-glutamine methyltransferase [Exiguobacterium
MRIAARLKQAERMLVDAGRDPSTAEWWLMHVLGVDRTGLIVRLSEELSDDETTAFESGLERLLAGEPVQHLIGQAPFYGRSFAVNRDVLIPRPETEELIEWVVEHVGPIEDDAIVDVGTGSGAIAITLSLELGVRVQTVDISREAIAVAKRNAEVLRADVTFHEGDCLGPVADDSIRVLVSNPPYIEADELLDETVAGYEPHLALFGGADGLEFYRKIIADSTRVLRADWQLIAFEIGYNQGQVVKSYLSERYPEAETGILKDINGKDRIVYAVREGIAHGNEMDQANRS